MDKRSHEFLQAVKDFLTFTEITLDDRHDKAYRRGWIIVTFDPETDEWDARGIFDDPRKATKEAEVSLANITQDGGAPYLQLVMPLYDYYSEKKNMATAYKCDGCLKHHDGEPAFTIERTDGLTTLAEGGTWHACSWPCVENIGRARTISLEER